MKKTVIRCDVCTKTGRRTDQKLQVIFTTEQNEGRTTEHYLSFEQLDICERCYSRVLAGESLFAYGAMGFNKYYFRARTQNSATASPS